MKKKLILACGSLLMGLVMLASGILLVVNDRPRNAVADTPAATTVPDAPIVSAEEFADPAGQYRALRIAHDFQSLPGSSAEERAEKLKAYGFGGVITNDGWDSKYLKSEQKLERLNSFVQTVRNSGLRVWLYDEKGYPSGSAGDLVVEENGKYQAVTLEQIAVSGNGTALQTADIPQNMVEPYMAYLTADKKTYTQKEVSVLSGKLRFDGLAGDWSGFVYVISKRGSANNGYAKTYPNILNKEAVQRFIEVTYETYNGAIENFSDTVEAFFTDEPTLMATRNLFNAEDTYPTIPYDYGMIEDFEKKYGVDLKTRLPLLFNDLSDDAKLLRAQFYEYIGTLVSENYFGQINAWCEAHGAKGSGHLLLEEQMKYHLPIYGDYFRSSAAMGYPGFDILNPRPASYIAGISTGAKYASSPAWLNNKDRVFVELCPVTDPDEFAQNHLDYALGTMTFAYFDGGNQVATYYTQANSEQETGVAFNNYVGRLGSMTAGAVNKTRIGIFYSIDTVGANYIPPADQSVYSPYITATMNDQAVNTITADLRKKGLDYVFVDDAAIQNGTVGPDCLDCGRFSFTTVIVPRAEVMDYTTLQKLCALADTGVNVIFVQAMPRLAMNAADQAKLKALSDGHGELCVLKAEDVIGRVTTKIAMTLQSKQTVMISPWEKNGQEFYFLANADNSKADVTVCYEGVSSFRLYDPVTGTVTETKDPHVTIDPYRALFVQPVR